MSGHVSRWSLSHAVASMYLAGAVHIELACLWIIRATQLTMIARIQRISGSLTMPLKSFIVPSKRTKRRTQLLKSLRCDLLMKFLPTHSALLTAEESTLGCLKITFRSSTVPAKRSRTWYVLDPSTLLSIVSK